MTYKEAKMQIQAIPEKIWDQLSEPDREAMEMAFSALQAQEAKVQLSAEGTTNLQPTCNNLATDCISRQAAIEALSEMHCKSDEDGYVWIIRSDAWWRIETLPSAEPEIIRCKDCKHYDPNDHCFLQGAGPEDYCSYAERRTDDL